MMVQACAFCGHRYEGAPTDDDINAHLEECPGPPAPEDCECSRRRGLARALPCRACAAQAAAVTGREALG